MKENIIDLDVNSLYESQSKKDKDLILNFSSKYRNYSEVTLFTTEVNNKTEDLLKCLDKIDSLCLVCRIFINRYELFLDYENSSVSSKIRLSVHSGSMIDLETLEREIRIMISSPPFDKTYMTWILSKF